MAYFFLKMNRKSWFIFDLSKNDCDFVGEYAKLNSSIFLFLEGGANHILILDFFCVFLGYCMDKIVECDMTSFTGPSCSDGKRA